MDTIFMNSGNIKTSKPHALILKLTNKLDLALFRIEPKSPHPLPPSSYQFFPVTSTNVRISTNNVLVSTLLLHWCKILSFYLVPLPNY